MVMHAENGSLQEKVDQKQGIVKATLNELFKLASVKFSFAQRKGSRSTERIVNLNAGWHD